MAWQTVFEPLRNLGSLCLLKSDSARSRLRSSTTRSAVTVRTRTKLGGRAFPVSGPTVWNSMPSELRLTAHRLSMYISPTAEVASVPTGF